MRELASDALVTASRLKPIHEPDFVNVLRDGGNAMINIPWKKYGRTITLS